MTKTEQTSKQTTALPMAPEYSAWGRGETFLKNLIRELQKEKGA